MFYTVGMLLSLSIRTVKVPPPPSTGSFPLIPSDSLTTNCFIFHPSTGKEAPYSKCFYSKPFFVSFLPDPLGYRFNPAKAATFLISPLASGTWKAVAIAK